MSDEIHHVQETVQMWTCCISSDSIFEMLFCGRLTPSSSGKVYIDFKSRSSSTLNQVPNFDTTWVLSYREFVWASGHSKAKTSTCAVLCTIPNICEYLQRGKTTLEHDCSRLFRQSLNLSGSKAFALCVAKCVHFMESVSAQELDLSFKSWHLFHNNLFLSWKTIPP